MTTMPERPLIPTDTNDLVRTLAGDSQILSFNRDKTEITDTVGIADGQMQMYVSGSTIVIKVYDADAGAWRALTAS